MKGRVLASVALIGWLAAPGGAVELDRGDLRLELRGELRNLFTFTRELEPERLFLEGSTRRRDAGLWLARGRLDGQAAWRDRLYAQVVYDMEFRTGSALRTLGFRVGDEAGTDTWLDADRPIAQHRDGDLRHTLYRAWLRYESEGFEWTLGRQRIPLGRARLWTPSDLFNPIPPLAIEGDQRIGVDALRARLRLAPGLWGGLIWAPQDDPDRHRAALRLELNRQQLDAAAMLARIEQDWVLGVDAAADLWGAAARFEATFTDLDAGDRIWQVVGSIDYTLAVGTGLYLLAEHFYNENRVSSTGAPVLGPLPNVEVGLRLLAAQARRLLSRLTTVALHQSGVQAGYDLTPLVRADLLALYDWSDHGLAIVPLLTWSARPDTTLSVGAQLFLGTDRSQYGSQANLLLLQIDSYF